MWRVASINHWHVAAERSVPDGLEYFPGRDAAPVELEKPLRFAERRSWDRLASVELGEAHV
jgi:hypothetical protein